MKLNMSRIPPLKLLEWIIYMIVIPIIVIIICKPFKFEDKYNDPYAAIMIPELRGKGDKKAEEVQYNVTTNINRGTVEFINGKTAADYKAAWKNPPELQEQLDELRARVKKLEEQALRNRLR